MFRLAMLLFGLVSTTLVGISIIAVVTVPALYDRAMVLIPSATLGALLLAVPTSWLIARSIFAQGKREHPTVLTGGAK